MRVHVGHTCIVHVELRFKSSHVCSEKFVNFEECNVYRLVLFSLSSSHRVWKLSYDHSLTGHSQGADVS